MYLDLNSATKQEIKKAIEIDSDMKNWFLGKDLESMSLEDARDWANKFFALYSKTLSV